MDAKKRQLDDEILRLKEERERLQATIESVKQSLAKLDAQMADAARRKSAREKKQVGQ